MPATLKTLTLGCKVNHYEGEQVAAVLTYVRRSWGNAALPITPDDVREIRGATAGRKKAWTEAELAAIRR